jgi:ATP-dependent Clp protease ATP-binding subunit ClpA
MNENKYKIKNEIYYKYLKKRFFYKKKTYIYKHIKIEINDYFNYGLKKKITLLKEFKNRKKLYYKSIDVIKNFISKKTKYSEFLFNFILNKDFINFVLDENILLSSSFIMGIDREKFKNLTSENKNSFLNFKRKIIVNNFIKPEDFNEKILSKKEYAYFMRDFVKNYILPKDYIRDFIKKNEKLNDKIKNFESFNFFLNLKEKKIFYNNKKNLLNKSEKMQNFENNKPVFINDELIYENDNLIYESDSLIYEDENLENNFFSTNDLNTFIFINDKKNRKKDDYEDDDEDEDEDDSIENEDSENFKANENSKKFEEFEEFEELDESEENENDEDENDDDFYNNKNNQNSNNKQNWLFGRMNDDEYNKPVDFKKFTRDLTKEAQEGKLDPVIGREKEINRLIQVLSRKTKNNPVIVGEPGVGKTAVIEGLAQKITSFDVPDNLLDCQIIMLDIGSLIAGTRYRGEFEERLRFLIDKIQKSSKRILFIDEIHTLIGAGSAEGTMDAANMLKPVLARGGFRCIGATTLKEYKKYIERDPALERRFQPIVVDPPSVSDTVVILAGLRRLYESFHDVLITNEALMAAAKYSDQYIPDRFLPDKAIDIIDEACSHVKLESTRIPDAIKSYTKELNQLLLEKDRLIRQQNYYMAAKIYEKEKQIRSLIKTSLNTTENQLTENLDL